MILERVGATVADFFDNFSNTTCSEHVISTVDSPYAAERPQHYEGKFNYVALVKPGTDKTRLQEFRTDSKGEPAKLGGAVVTSGFVSLPAHFHPAYQRDSRFRYLGRELVKGQNTYVVAFAQRPGVARQAGRVTFSDKTGFVFVQGVAWIDPVSFRILRLRTEIQQPELNVGLQRETTEVEYSEVTFKQGGKTLWLPREVTVSGQLRPVYLLQPTPLLANTGFSPSRPRRNRRALDLPHVTMLNAGSLPGRKDLCVRAAREPCPFFFSFA